MSCICKILTKNTTLSIHCKPKVLKYFWHPSFVASFNGYLYLPKHISEAGGKFCTDIDYSRSRTSSNPRGKERNMFDVLVPSLAASLLENYDWYSLFGQIVVWEDPLNLHYPINCQCNHHHCQSDSYAWYQLQWFYLKINIKHFLLFLLTTSESCMEKS